jgi:hypothetical protein
MSGGRTRERKITFCMPYLSPVKGAPSLGARPPVRSRSRVPLASLSGSMGAFESASKPCYATWPELGSTDGSTPP